MDWSIDAIVSENIITVNIVKTSDVKNKFSFQVLNVIYCDV